MDANGCTASIQSVTVTVISLPVIDFTSDLIEGCVPLCVTFNNQTLDAATCNWIFSNQINVSGCDVVQCFSTPGLIDVSLAVTDVYGCSNSKHYNNFLTVFPKPEADFLFSPTYANIFEPHFSFSDFSAGAMQWFWEFGDPGESVSHLQNPLFTYRDTGTFLVSLIVTNQFGCLDTIIKRVTVEEMFNVFIPNAFTPEEINPVFKPVFALQNVERYNFKIINRWGEIIYETQNLNDGWNGSKAGKKLPEGVCIFIVEAEYRSKVIKKMGHVTLLR